MSFGLSPGGAISRAVLLDHNALISLGNTLIIAPHPDDESLACGGLIALLSSARSPYVVFISDGTMSHPGSKKYPARELMLLREEEALKALSILQVPPDNGSFLRLKDSKVPSPEKNGFDKAVKAIAEIIVKIKPGTVIIPWRRDPHPDHRAAWHLVKAALKYLNSTPLILEYPLWLWERGSASDLPEENEVNFYRFDISSVLHLKQEAITAHLSQISNIIDDDPGGFQLSAGMLAHFNRAYETFMTNSNTFIK